MYIGNKYISRLLTFYMEKMKHLIFCITIVFMLGYEVISIYVDHGNPYDYGKLRVGDLTITKITDRSPLHTVAHFPLLAGEYPVVYFIGGLNGYMLVEWYTDVLRMVAAHGFVVFGVDYKFPVFDDAKHFMKHNFKQDVELFFKEIDFLKEFMENKMSAKPVWNKIALVCHSAGCDCFLRMLRMNATEFTSTIFLEPFSIDALDPMPDPIPALMYGTQLAEEVAPKCSLPGTDFNQFYKIWKCPRLALEVADFGHCDIMNQQYWTVCTDICARSNETRLDEYHRFIQGAISSFLMTTLQGRQDAITYISNITNVPVKLIEHQTDWNCIHSKGNP